MLLRRFLLVTLVTSTLTVSREELSLAANFPFGSHKFTYAQGAILPNNNTDMDSKTSSFYDDWKSKYLIKACKAGQFYVWSGKTDGGGRSAKTISTSESQGYGMLLIPLMAGYDPQAQIYYDGLFKYFKSHHAKSSSNLMAWNQLKGCINSRDDDTATDGDLDIAFSLLLADRQWGSDGEIDYLEEAKKTIRDIADLEINKKTATIFLGDFVNDTPKYLDGTRTSDFMPDHFRAFAKATGDSSWNAVIDTSYELITTIQNNFSPSGLLPDFISNLDSQPSPAPPNYLEGPYDGEFNYNACRDPWRLGTDYLVSGEPRAIDALQKMNAWVKSKSGGVPKRIVDGYTLKGTKSREASDPSMAFVPPFAVSAMVDSSNQDWLNALWTFTASTSSDGEDYFGNTIKLLSMIVLSGNWFSP